MLGLVFFLALMLGAGLGVHYWFSRTPRRRALNVPTHAELFEDTHHRAGIGWAAIIGGLGIAGTTTMWIERRQSGLWAGGFRTGDEDFDRAFFIGGDGGTDLEAVMSIEEFRAAVYALFKRVNPAAVEIDVDGYLVVRTARSAIDAAGRQALLDSTTAFADALGALANKVRLRARELASGGDHISVGGESGAPLPVPAQRE